MRRFPLFAIPYPFAPSRAALGYCDMESARVSISRTGRSAIPICFDMRYMNIRKRISDSAPYIEYDMVSEGRQTALIGAISPDLGGLG